ncbi:AI-2E family transporter [Microvirga alba]|uniref:AI-2E family transporter n=1 Tax=Microvirga alba TaxID=2791025 RepID=A0A931BWM9_9HYPH|nr:AI-2E family transporter [Microvirga alba]MBF9235210.1 AI-2E family transporter [Microvirga alba]
MPPTTTENARQPLSETEVEPPRVPGINGLTTLAVGIVVLVALYIGQEVFLPIVLAILLAFLLAPFVELMRKWHFGRIPSVIIAVLFALGIIAALGSLIGFQVAGLATDLPRYQTTIKEKVRSLREQTFARLPSVINEIGNAVTEEQSATRPSPVPSPAPQVNPLPVEVHERPATPLEIVRSIAAPVLQPLTTAGIVLVVLIFILLQREDLRDRMIRLFGARDLHRATAAMDDAGRRLSRYFLMQLGLNASFGVMIGIGLWLIGVPSPALWGVIAALMRFVPYIGSFIGAVFPILVASAVDPGWSMALMTAALFLIGEPLMGQVVEPFVYGKSTGLSPFAVVISAIFWTWLWGPIGLVIATPLTLCLVVLGRHVERLEFLSVLLGDQPALTPAENLYQRMLAGDPDEALESAEALLKTCSPMSYYDDVAIEALRLAAGDASRGVLTSRQLAQVKDVAHALIQDLNSYDDVERSPDGKKAESAASAAGAEASTEESVAPQSPPESDAIPDTWKADGAILCVAGRGPLDAAAAAMMAQLIEKHGLGERVIPYEAVSRFTAFNLDASGAQMVCLCYLDVGGTPAHLRYLVQRLRRHVPDVPILVGLWSKDDAVLKDANLRGALGADYYVSTLREGVSVCVKLARGEEEPAQKTDSSVSSSKATQAAGVKRLPLPA